MQELKELESLVAKYKKETVNQRRSTSCYTARKYPSSAVSIAEEN